jgi:hypothetical protein
LSLGIGDDWRFEEALHNTHNLLAISAVDPDMTAKTFIGNPKTKLFRGHFGLFDGSFGATLDELNSHFSDENRVSLLKMDVESSEYSGLFHSSVDSISRYSVICCELHAFEYLDKPGVYNLIFSVLEKLAKTHTVISLIPNNACPVYYHHGRPIPQLLEVTYLRNDYVTEKFIVKDRIEDYDHQCVADKPRIVWNAFDHI